MSVLLKTTYIYIFTTIVTFLAYAFWIFGVVGVDHFAGPDALVRIGRAIVTLIVAGYGFEFFVLFAVGIFGFKVMKNTKTDLTVDERDRQILFKSLSLSHMVLCSGIFLSVGAMSMGLSAFWVFNMLVLAFYLSVVAELAAKLFLYKTGI